MRKIAHLVDRAVLAVSGEDRVGFLQGLVSNDVTQVTPGRAVWAALLTPQGKWVADFFVFSDGQRLLLDCGREEAPAVASRLSRLRLRSKVAVEPTALSVYAGWDGAAPEGTLVAADPRLAEAGFRLLGPDGLEVDADAADYDRHRLLLGLPDGRDLEAEKSLLLEAGFDELHGVSWTKGCYMGQELTARTRYRGLIKRRLVPVSAPALPPPGTILRAGEREAGVMRSSRDGFGMATLRLEFLHEAIEGGGVTMRARVPDWMVLSAATAGS